MTSLFVVTILYQPLMLKKHRIIFTSVKLCSKLCIILRSIATTTLPISRPYGLKIVRKSYRKSNKYLMILCLIFEWFWGAERRPILLAQRAIHVTASYSPTGHYTLRSNLFHMEIGDGLEAIEEVAGRHALFASELKIEDFEPLVGGRHEETGLLNE